MTDGQGRVVRRLTVPGDPGTHRVNWDLRWDMDDEADTWQAHDDPLLARPVDARGFFVAPGSYTVTLEARGETRSRTVRVHGDPLVPTLTIDDYKDREAFLLEVRDLMQRLRAGVAGMAPQTAGRMQGTLAGIFRAMNGGGVRPGSIHPPTLSQQEAVAAIRAAIGMD